jgi:hypothetical protein
MAISNIRFVAKPASRLDHALPVEDMRTAVCPGDLLFAVGNGIAVATVRRDDRHQAASVYRQKVAQHRFWKTTAPCREVAGKSEGRPGCLSAGGNAAMSHKPFRAKT